jgi:hypothetical protein
MADLHVYIPLASQSILGRCSSLYGRKHEKSRGLSDTCLIKGGLAEIGPYIPVPHACQLMRMTFISVNALGNSLNTPHHQVYFERIERAG